MATFLKIDVSGAGDHTLVAGVAGQTIIVDSLVLVVSALTTLKIKSGTTDLTGAMKCAANAAFVVPAGNVQILATTGAGDSLILNIGVLGGQVGGWIGYTQG
jgi:hypothetical protein